MVTTGSDAAAGTSAAPWATPNHAMNCGDIVLASPGTYPQIKVNATVTCKAGNNVAWVQCSNFDACKINVTSGTQYSTGIQVSSSYWGFQGWEVHTISTAGACYFVYPATPSLSIHHVVFANNIANGCGQGGFTASNDGAAGVDYFAVVGNIVYSATQGSSLCTSGINVFKPVALDSLPGTHIYLAGNFSFNNVEPKRCNGTPPTDGQGINLDMISPYDEQIVIDNNIAAYNGGNGIKVYSSAKSHIYVRHNTTYGNETGGVDGAVCSEIGLQSTALAEVFKNLSATSTATACSAMVADYVFGVISPATGNLFYRNYGYSAASSNSSSYSAVFSFRLSNLFSSFPWSIAPADPEAPNCSAFSGVPACMASVVATFKPTVTGAQAYGYQTPGTASLYDPLFPRWLCNVNLPAGLITRGCLAGSSDRR